MLLDNFYTILSSEQPDETSGTVLLELNPDHAIYQGHFPAHPVVPGVCLLQLIKESVENILLQVSFGYQSHRYSPDIIDMEREGDRGPQPPVTGRRHRKG